MTRVTPTHACSPFSKSGFYASVASRRHSFVLRCPFPGGRASVTLASRLATARSSSQRAILLSTPSYDDNGFFSVSLTVFFSVYVHWIVIFGISTVPVTPLSTASRTRYVNDELWWLRPVDQSQVTTVHVQCMNRVSVIGSNTSF